MEKRLVYLDNSATTKISAAALAKYNEISLNQFGNPSSLHSMGFDAEKEIENAKKAVLESLGAKDSSVVFTSSGSEANNLAIIGRALSKDRYRRGAKIITTMGEHASVNEPIKRLSELGFKTVYIPTRNGEIDLEALKNEMTPDVVLVSVMMVNNETGALYDTAAVYDIMKAYAHEALLHIDATQSYMKIPFTKQSVKGDMITVSSHKINGPKGVGALIIANKVLKEKGLAPIIYGGGQGLGLRSGTENVPAIAAFGVAVRENVLVIRENFEKLSMLREYLIEKLTSTEELKDISLTLPKKHAPHILNITLPGIKSETMLHYLSAEGVFVSSGSACSSNSRHTSSALTAYGRSESEADTSLRVSFSHENTTEDADALCLALAMGLKRLARIRK